MLFLRVDLFETFDRKKMVIGIAIMYMANIEIKKNIKGRERE